MRRTRPVKNQVAYHERMFDHGEFGEFADLFIMDITVSTVHKIILTGDINFAILPIAESEMIPETSFMTMTLIVEQDEVGGHTIVFPNNLRWAYDTDIFLYPDPGSIEIITFFSYDSGETWNAFRAGMYREDWTGGEGHDIELDEEGETGGTGGYDDDDDDDGETGGTGGTEEED